MSEDHLEPQNSQGLQGSPDLPFYTTIQEVEDPELESILGCLAPSADLPDRIRRELPKQPARPSFVRRLLPAAALLLVGLALGAFSPFAPLRPVEEAEASLLRDNIAGYAQSSGFFAQEAGLLSSVDDPALASQLVRHQYRVAALRPTAVWIRNKLERSSADGFGPSERDVLLSFFSSAVARIDEMDSIMSRPDLSPSDIQWIGRASSEIVPSLRIRSVASQSLAILPPADVQDDRLSGYIAARSYMLTGETEKAISAFSSSFEGSDGVIQQLSGFWLTKCYLESGNRDRAVFVYRTLPVEFQRRLPIPGNTVEGHSSISIRITVPQHRNYESLHVLRTEQQTVVVSVYPDGSVKVSENSLSEEIYPSFDDFMAARPDLYSRIFERCKQ